MCCLRICWLLCQCNPEDLHQTRWSCEQCSWFCFSRFMQLQLLVHREFLGKRVHHLFTQEKMGMATSIAYYPKFISCSKARACHMGLVLDLFWHLLHFWFWSYRDKDTLSVYCPSFLMSSNCCRFGSKFWMTSESELKKLALKRNLFHSNKFFPWVWGLEYRLGWKRRIWSNSNRKLGLLTVIKFLDKKKILTAW